MRITQSQHCRAGPTLCAVPRQKSDLERMLVTVTPKQRAWLERRREETGLELTALVRQLIQQAIEAEERRA